jgi:predicted phosphodiesterase
MRIAIFSDVHGNLTGLEAVLADIAPQAPDLVVFAGDLCLMGPRPGECLRRVRALRLPAVMGNTDEWTAGAGEPPERLRDMLPWTRDQLTGDERDWLAGLPFGLTVSPTADPADDLRIVHANPRDLNAILFPSETHQTAYWSAVRQSDAELEPLLGGVTAAVLAFGHLHIPNLRQWGRLALVNVASVSMPGDGDARAKYALLTWADRQWTAEHRRVEYDTDQEAAAFREQRPPNWEEAATALAAEGHYYPQRV